MITIQGVTKSYGAVTAVNDVSLAIERQEFFGLLGPNGAGKSTLMNLMTGYLSADTGSVTINGTKVSKNGNGYRHSIGYVPQSLALYDDLNAIENLTIFGRLYHLPSALLKKRIEELLQAVQLSDRRKDKVKGFSGGMKRRLNIAASLLHDPAVILCDEPTVGVDPQSRNAIFDFLESLNKAGKTIVYTTHYMEEAERLCSRIAVIDGGKIIALGTIDELLQSIPDEETIVLKRTAELNPLLERIEEFGNIITDNEKIEIKPHHGMKLSNLFAELEKLQIPYANIDIRRPNLEALFLHLTGRNLRD